MQLMEFVRLCRHDLQCIDQAIAYIEKNYPNRISTEDLAMEVGLNSKKLQAGFKRRTGSTVHDYIKTLRVEKSKPLLADTDLPLKAIVHATGFKSCSHFCQVFKTITALTPIEFRFKAAI